MILNWWWWWFLDSLRTGSVPSSNIRVSLWSGSTELRMVWGYPHHLNWLILQHIHYPHPHITSSSSSTSSWLRKAYYKKCTVDTQHEWIERCMRGEEWIRKNGAMNERCIRKSCSFSMNWSLILILERHHRSRSSSWTTTINKNLMQQTSSSSPSAAAAAEKKKKKQDKNSFSLHPFWTSSCSFDNSWWWDFCRWWWKCCFSLLLFFSALGSSPSAIPFFPLFESHPHIFYPILSHHHDEPSWFSCVIFLFFSTSLFFCSSRISEQQTHTHSTIIMMNINFILTPPFFHPSIQNF